MDWYLKCLRNYAVFTGRAHRTEYWMFVLFNIVFALIISVIDALFFKFLRTRLHLEQLYYLAVFIPSLAVTARRLHDTGRSAWWILVSLLPFVGWILLLVFTVQDSEPGSNQYGPNPKEEALAGI